MKVVSTEALTKLIQLVKSAFIKVDDVVEVTEIETETPSEVTLANVATSGDYDDLTNKPTIPTVNNATLTITQGGVSKGTFTANASSNVTIALDAGGGSSLTAGVGIDITNDVISVDGVKDQRNTSTAIKTWTGTLAQYNNIQSKDANTQYMITDTGEIYLGITLLSNYGADTSLSNLTSTGKNIANWSNNVTNCITEIPQDIKLELNNGTLTIKAGSKIYKPNGVGVFDTRVFTQDVSVSVLGSVTGQFILSYGQSAWSSADTFDYFNVSQINLFSGPSQPTTTSSNTMWYDTTNNVIKTTNNFGSTWTVTNNTFPICIVTASSGTILSIDQVFNGFGYIGSTIFALPGVKGLIPNGRNADGSLKSIEVITDKVTTLTYSSSDTARRYLIITNTKEIGGYINNIYKKEDNINVDGSGVKQLVYRCGSFNTTSGTISNFIPKTVFHAADDNTVVHLTGTETISGAKTISIDNLNLSQDIYLNSWGSVLPQYNAASNPTHLIELYKNAISDNSDRFITWNMSQIKPNGDVIHGLFARSTDGNTNVTADISVIVNKNGNKYALAPSSDTNGSIVTTVNKSKASNGYFQLGNGMIVQWGLNTIAANVTTANVTYPKAFTSASSYAVLTCHRGASKTQSMTRPANPSATGFTCNYNTTHTDARYFYWIAIGY